MPCLLEHVLTCEQHFLFLIFWSGLSYVRINCNQISDYLGFEVFTVVTMKNAIFWDVAPCRFCVNQHFGGMYRLHLQGRKINERGISMSRWQRTESVSRWFLMDFSIPKMEAIRYSETSVHTRYTRHHIPEDGILSISDCLFWCNALFCKVCHFCF
jgi:hypothetical protein